MKTNDNLETERELTLMQMMTRFSTEESARTYFENLLWPNGAVCPHCGNNNQDRIYKLTANTSSKVRKGLHKCAECNERFTVTMNTVMEDSHIPLNKWLIAFYMMCASKTQISALQLQRHLELGSYRTAWFMCHRIRFTLKDAMPADKLEGTVEADETYIGGRVRGRGRRYVGNKTPVVSLVERSGRVRSTVMDKVNGQVLTRLLRKHVAESSHLNTDESGVYNVAGKSFASHERVNHGEEEYARTGKNGRRVTTNTVEGFFGNTKRSLDGTHHHVTRKYLPLYMAEIDHKYNLRKVSDGERTKVGIKLVSGKRLMLRTPLKIKPQ
jgi:transposase-like protein